MSEDEGRRELERKSREGDPDARRALLQARLREEGTGAFVMDFIRTLLEAGPLTASKPYRDACGAVVRYVGEQGSKGSWCCPVCGCKYPYIFWDMKSEALRKWEPGEVVILIDEDACPECGELSGGEEGARALPVSEAPSLKPHLEAVSGMTGAKASKSHAQECRCQRKRRILEDEVKALKAQADVWRHDIAFLSKGADEDEAAGLAIVAERKRKAAEKAEAELARFECRLQELRQELTVDRKTDA